jgi:hypothetical protein
VQASVASDTRHHSDNHRVRCHGEREPDRGEREDREEEQQR